MKYRRCVICGKFKKRDGCQLCDSCTDYLVRVAEVKEKINKATEIQEVIK